MLNLKNKRVTIIGGKRSGVALAKLVVHYGGRAKISEAGTADSLPEDFKKWAKEKNVIWECGGHTPEFIKDSDVIVLSPGVRHDALPVHWAQEKVLPVLGEIEFAYQFCTKPVIAVTGSNGKTTVTTLISRVINEAGFKATLCGNVGIPFSGEVLNTHRTDYFVIEVSSFQMESLLDQASHFRRRPQNGHILIDGFKPFIAVMLNFSQNHLDRHKDLDEYLTAKKRIFLNQEDTDYAVLNERDSIVRNLASEVKSQVVYFNSSDNDRKLGITNPNFSAVWAVANILEISSEVCQNVFEKFRGIEHRLEWVRAMGGVDFINDSKSTTVASAGWALERMEKPVLMICGGKEKHMDYTVLSPIVRQKVKKMFVIGEARKNIKKAFEGVVDIEECESLDQAVLKAKTSAKAGDCVVLSPMCASFDMFSDYEHRGKVFKEIVNTLK